MMTDGREGVEQPSADELLAKIEQSPLGEMLRDERGAHDLRPDGPK